MLALMGAAGVALASEVPPTIDKLREQKYATALELVRDLPPGPGFSAQLFSYQSAGLKVHAYVAVPTRPMPAGGYPVLVANHGTHPDPPRYGFTAQGVDSRPGDYYRSIPELFTAEGFMVVMPDYRGHNVSEGREYARGFLAANFYAADVLALLAALPVLKQADMRNVFMWGHSLGGEVTLKALLATSMVRGASLWSTVGGDIWDQAYHYATSRGVDHLYDSSELPKDTVVQLRDEIERLGGRWDYREADPLARLGDLHVPLMLQHSHGDEGAPFRWSVQIAKELYRLGKPYVFHAYPGDGHFFEGDDRLLAVARDAAFFRGLMRQVP
jgi:dipeptidyl aminopeptidase/acylaminoacyl peptidase